jgi:hypothetical protein
LNERVEGSGGGVIAIYYPSIPIIGLRKPKKTLATIAGLLVEI